MLIYPAIELMDGQCVSLHRGRIEQPEIWDVDPVQKALEFTKAGAEWIHVTDLNGVAGSGNNNGILRQILRTAEAPVQLGGGFRSLDTISEWIDLGVGRVVVGTLAVTSPHLVKRAAKYHPDQIVLAVDVFKGHVMSDGWRQPSAFEPEAFVRNFDDDPLAAIIITDISADLGETEEPLALITRLARVARAPVIARGLSRSLDDLSRMKYVPGISGAILGRALFEKTIDISEAIALGNEPTEAVAEFI